MIYGTIPSPAPAPARAAATHTDLTSRVCARPPACVVFRVVGRTGGYIKVGHCGGDDDNPLVPNWPFFHPYRRIAG